MKATKKTTTATTAIAEERMRLGSSATAQISDIASCVRTLTPDGEERAAIVALMNRIEKLSAAIYYVLEDLGEWGEKELTLLREMMEEPSHG